MSKVPGPVWLVGLAAVVILIAATAVPYAAPASGDANQVVQTFRVAPLTLVNPRTIVAFSLLVVVGLLLLLFVYRRRLFIVFWIVGWLTTALAMFMASSEYANPRLGAMAYGLSQFLAIISTLFFVVGADAYRTRPHIRREYALVLLPVLLWFSLAPLPLGPSAVFAPGHLLIGGGFAAAGLSHLLLVRQTRMLGAGVIGVAFLVIAGANAWTALASAVPEASGGALYTSLALYLTAALGMQLMTFEDMTSELRRTNRRLQTAQNKLRRMVITDPLTGCRNRRFFEEIIGREVQRHRRYGIPLSVVFVDIDRFKAVNDTYGHETGDRVLQQVASFLLSNIREADYVFRWGGDEFLILLSCGEQEARRRAVTLQKAFANSPETASLPRGVGLSVGAAELDDDSDDVITLVRTADERMYENKRALTQDPRQRALPMR
ncbi:MAG TPA: GGDEF domain-containing protein [Vicinamibacterales bacterium]|jgi:diguanylate cyclase (GGDEF)-like protein|nr:GGDEF domain-containing protein [Vicinamibacterales bacterium]